MDRQIINTTISLQCNRTSIETFIAQYEQIQTIKPSKAKAFIGLLPVNYHKNRYNGDFSSSVSLQLYKL